MTTDEETLAPAEIKILAFMVWMSPVKGRVSYDTIDDSRIGGVNNLELAMGYRRLLVLKFIETNGRQIWLTGKGWQWVESQQGQVKAHMPKSSSGSPF